MTVMSEQPVVVISDDKPATSRPTAPAFVPLVYSTNEAADFLNRSHAWLYERMRVGAFRYPKVWHTKAFPSDNWHVCRHPDGEPFEPNDGLRGKFVEVTLTTDESGAEVVEEPTPGDEVIVSELGETERQGVWREVDGTALFRYYGDLIEPERLGKAGRRRFTIDIIHDIALSCFRSGNYKEPELRQVLGRIDAAKKRAPRIR